MAFWVVRDDITRVAADAIVNTANPKPTIGAGTDTAIHKAAGPELIVARRRIGRINVGCVAATPAYNLNATYVLHAVGPVWQDGRHGEPFMLRMAYYNALRLALEKGCRSIAFPLMGAGSYGVPNDVAISIAVDAFTDFLSAHDMDIMLVVFSAEATALADARFDDLRRYVDDRYVEDQIEAEYAPSPSITGRLRSALGLPEDDDLSDAQCDSDDTDAPGSPSIMDRLRSVFGRSDDDEFDDAPPIKREDAVTRRDTPDDRLRSRREAFVLPRDLPDAPEKSKDRPLGRRDETVTRRSLPDDRPHIAPTAAPKPAPAERNKDAAKPPVQTVDEDFEALSKLLMTRESTFSEHLIELLKARDVKDSVIYNRAQMSRQLFNKIVNDRDYRPGKSTVLQLAIGLELDLDDTRKLLGKAGYALTASSKSDLVVSYYIDRKLYNIVKINIALFNYGLPPLGRKSD